MSESDETEHFHLHLDLSHDAIVGWKRYVAQFKNSSEAFENLSEVRMNKAPARLDIK